MIIRWICGKDGKKWLYPIEKCIYCKGPITKQITSRAKVIGMTKVNIPSPMHPIIPYNILLLEDEHGNRIPKKTMGKYDIGETYEIKPAKSEDAVIVTKVKYDIKEYLRETLSLLNNYALDENDSVLIIPGVSEAAYNYQAINTNPKVVEALIECLKDNGVTDIMVAGRALPGNDTIDSAKKSGIFDACKKNGIEFTELGKMGFEEKEYDGFRFNIAKEALERKTINVPVMKTNSQIILSGAMENMIRAVDKDTEKRMFDEDIEKTLPKLMKALPGFLSIGDATIGLQGNGPLLGEPAFLNMIFASRDAVALDAVFSEAFILPMPAYAVEAAAMGAGKAETKKIEIVGEDLEAIKYPIKQAEKDSTAHSKIKLVDGRADPKTLVSALNASSKLVGVGGHELYLVIGKQLTKEKLEGKSRLVAYGDDAIAKTKELGAKVVAEIPDGIEDIEKIVLIKSILEDKSKEKLTQVDRLKSKMAMFGAKLRGKR